VNKTVQILLHKKYLRHDSSQCSKEALIALSSNPTLTDRSLGRYGEGKRRSQFSRIFNSWKLLLLMQAGKN
jgi:hypothetical protein